MKILFFGPSPSRADAAHHSRVLSTLLEGIVDRGHHLVYVDREGDNFGARLPFAKVIRYAEWEAVKETIDAECEDASAIVLTSGFGAGHAAVDWLLEANVPAHVYYELDPWETLEAFESEGAAPWVRADQIPRFDIVFSVAGGPAIEAFKTRWGAEEAVTLYEAIDSAIFHARSPVDDYACDLALVSDRNPAAEATFDSYLVEVARALPGNRFVVAGSGWSAAGSWPANLEVFASGNADLRATIYSSARAVLVPIGPSAIDYAMPFELLEPAACGAACAVVDRPGLGEIFDVRNEIFVPESPADLVALLASGGDSRLHRLGNLVEKRVILDYSKLHAATKFEQRVARKFYRGHNG